MPLLRIQTVPTAAAAAIHLHPTDNVAIARAPLSSGQEIEAGGREIHAIQPIPASHKVALREILAGEKVIRYGYPIGRASVPIRSGEHIHTHNLALEEADLGHELSGDDNGAFREPAQAPVFQGYLRADGRAGTRNYIAVAAASNCGPRGATHRGQVPY
jgi:altronate dehydratase